MKLSLVIPILNEKESIKELIRATELLGERIESTGNILEIILNDNCSDDGTSNLLRDWVANNPKVTHVTFEKRLSFQQSIIRGFRRATGDCVVVFQGDLQDPWELVLKFFDEWLSGNKVIVGVALNRHSSLPQSLFRKLFYAALRLGASREMKVGFQDFYLLDRSVYQSIATLPNNFQFIRGIIARDFGVDKVLNYERNYRRFGKSKFRLGDKYDLALDALLIHSQSFTRFLSFSGILISMLSSCLLLLLGALWLLQVNFGATGWLSTFALLSLLVGVVSFATAIQIEFLRRVLTIALDRNTFD